MIFDLDNLSSATNHNGGALAFGPDGKLYAAVGENDNSANSQSLNTVLGKMLRLNTDGTIADRQPVPRLDERQESRDLGARPSQPVHVRVQPSRNRAVHQRCGRNHLGRDQRWPRRSQLRLADDGGIDHESQLQESEIRVRPLVRRVRDYRRGLLLSLDESVSFRLRQRLLLRGLLRGLDQETRSGRREHRHDIRDGNFVSGRSEGGRRRQPVLPGSRQRAPSIEFNTAPPGRRITSHPTSQTVAPGASVTFSVRASGPPPLRYQWRRNGDQHSWSDRAGLYDRVGRRCRQRRALSGDCQQRLRYDRRAEQRGHADRHARTRRRRERSRNRSRARCIAAARSSTTPARRQIPRMGRCRRARSPGRWISITTPTCIRSSPRRRERRAVRSRFPRSGKPLPTCGIAST